MATLYDLAMQYLNQSLPKTFKYDRTPPIGTNPPGLFPQPPVKPIEKLLPRSGGNEEGFSVYNPDPNRTRNESNYNPRTYNKVMRDTDKFGETVMPNPDLYYTKELEGIPGMVQGYMKNSLPGRLIGNAVSGLESLLPVNQRAILENELLGQGFQLNDIGQIVSDGGDYDTAANVMSGYNANQITRQTFEKRRNKIKETMSKPGYKGNLQERLDALDEAEAKFFGGSAKATTVFNDKLKQKDIDDGFINDQIPTYDEEIKTSTYSENEEDDILDYTNPNIYNTNSIYTQTAPTYITDPYVSGQDDKDIGTTPPGTSDDGYVTDYYGGDPVIDAGGTAPGGGYATDYYGGDPVTDAGGTAPGGGYATDYYGGDSVTDAGGTAPGGGYATDYYGGGNDTGGGSTPDYSDVKTGGPPSQGGGGGGPPSQGGTHCCTAANERGDMTLTEVKKLRAWHRKQSKIWQKGYDVWGKVIADNLVAKSKWQSDRVRDFYNHKIYKKRTIGSIYADIVIYPMSIIIGSILTVMPPILGYQENKRHGKSSS